MTLNLWGNFKGISFGSTEPKSSLDPTENKHGFGSVDQNLLTLISVLEFASLNLNLGTLFHKIRFGSIDPNSSSDLIEGRHGVGSADRNLLKLINILEFANLNQCPKFIFKSKLVMEHGIWLRSTKPTSCLKLFKMLKG